MKRLATIVVLIAAVVVAWLRRDRPIEAEPDWFLRDPYLDALLEDCE